MKVRAVILGSVEEQELLYLANGSPTIEPRTVRVQVDERAPVVFGFNYFMVIGRVERIRLRDGRLVADMEIGENTVPTPHWFSCTLAVVPAEGGVLLTAACVMPGPAPFWAKSNVEVPDGH